MLSIMTPFGLADEGPKQFENYPPEQLLEKASIPEQSKALENSSVIDDVSMLWQELQGLGHDHLQLAALETRQAGESLVSMLISGMMIVGMLSCAWLGLMTAAVFALIEQGVLASSAILLAVAVNLLLVLVLYGAIRRKSFFLQFPATLNSLQPKPPVS
ncbi:MAG: phage holin family protein [Methylococcales bacterium]